MAAASLATLAGASAVSVALASTGPTPAPNGGLVGGLLGPGGVVGGVVSQVAGLLPTLPVLPTPPTATPTVPTTTPTALPVSGLCVAPLCTPAPNGNGGTGPGATPGDAGGTPAPAAVPGGGSSSGAGGADSGAATAGGTSDTVGLTLAPPPPIEQLTPLAGISFGQAPYLWPLFLVLDIGAAAAVGLAVRKTWSRRGAE